MRRERQDRAPHTGGFEVAYSFRDVWPNTPASLCPKGVLETGDGVMIETMQLTTKRGASARARLEVWAARTQASSLPRV